jgi:hypothetical protein
MKMLEYYIEVNYGRMGLQKYIKLNKLMPNIKKKDNICYNIRQESLYEGG